MRLIDSSWNEKNFSGIRWKRQKKKLWKEWKEWKECKHVTAPPPSPRWLHDQLRNRETRKVDIRREKVEEENKNHSRLDINF